MHDPVFELTTFRVRPEIVRCLVVLTLVTSSLTGCKELPEQEWRELKEVRLGLLSGGDVGRFERGQLQIFLRRFDLVRERFYREQATWALFRKPDDLERDLSSLVVAGRALRQRVQREKDRILEEQKAELNVIAGLTQLSPSRTLVPDLAPQQRSLGQRLKLAFSYLGRGEDQEVERLLAEIRTLSKDLQVLLDKIRMRFEDPDQIAGWDRLCEEAFRSSRAGDQPSILVVKFERELWLLQRGRVLQRFPIEIGWNGLFDKTRRGDGATPEGRYRVTRLKRDEQTNYHRALLLDYPNQLDRELFRKALREGALEPGAEIGGMIEIHGGGGRGRDWTDGCVALEDSDIDRVYGMSFPGMAVTVVGRCGQGD